MLFDRVCMCLIVFGLVWSCLIKFEGHQTFSQQLKTFLLFSCLMGDVLFVWTGAYQTCLMRACVPRFPSYLYQLFDLCLTQTCFNRLATLFNISMFGHQTMFDGVWSPNIYRLSRPLTVRPLTSTLACLVTKQCLMVFGRQILIVCPGPNTNANQRLCGSYNKW